MAPHPPQRPRLARHLLRAHAGHAEPRAAAAEGVRRRPLSGLLLRSLVEIGNPRFPLKDSFKGDIDIDREFDISYHNMGV